MIGDSVPRCDPNSIEMFGFPLKCPWCKTRTVGQTGIGREQREEHNNDFGWDTLEIYYCWNTKHQDYFVMITKYTFDWESESWE